MRITTAGFDEVSRKQQFFKTEINRRSKINAAYSERQHWQRSSVHGKFRDCFAAVCLFTGDSVCVSLPRWPSSGVCLVRRFLTKGTSVAAAAAAAAAAALHSFVANA